MSSLTRWAHVPWFIIRDMMREEVITAGRYRRHAERLPIRYGRSEVMLSRDTAVWGMTPDGVFHPELYAAGQRKMRATLRYRHVDSILRYPSPSWQVFAALNVQRKRKAELLLAQRAYNRVKTQVWASVNPSRNPAR